MLDAALTAAAGGGGVTLALTVTNEGDDPVTLRFRTGQRADFAAFESAGDEGDGPRRGTAGPVWRHGEGRLFTQALGTETLAPGESATYEGTWREPPPGVYLIEGTLTAEEHDAEATATVAVE
ncbi:BsuPI-related putative proteinase inhibitor [Halorubrum sp. AD140]|uniref:BsuPI-related putative proteinase inhibitor n=1 Tax=Halorubrum sp. AD140 TaxID=3050073 RepID=UPI002ACC8253|nr:BsuPI-related putative proteinase inhibitor [Halorubrum sp. AD140]MDZ5810937.1 BsuPI-related putative proteinase inhibitor [Halorubrum sp. AD140]